MKNDFVLLKELNKETETDSGIVYNSDKWSRKCEVVSTYKNSPLHVGDTIVKNVGKGTDIELNGEKYEILHIDWIIATL